jgi:hypothetical protein
MALLPAAEVLVMREERSLPRQPSYPQAARASFFFDGFPQSGVV